MWRKTKTILQIMEQEAKAHAEKTQCDQMKMDYANKQKDICEFLSKSYQKEFTKESKFEQTQRQKTKPEVWETEEHKEEVTQVSSKQGKQCGHMQCQGTS